MRKEQKNHMTYRDLMRFYWNVLRIFFLNFDQVNFNKKYTQSWQKMHIDLNWRFDTFSTMKILFNIDRRNHMRIAICVFIDYIIYIKFYIKFYLLIFIAHTSNCFRFDFRFLICVSTSWINETLLRNSHETFEKKFEKVLEKLFEKLFEKLLEKLNEKFSRIACMFHWKIEFMKKNTCLKHDATIKYALKKCLLKIIVVETRFKERKIMSRFLFVNIWYHSRDITYFIIDHRLASFDDSQTLTTRKFVFFFILKY